MKKIFAPVFIFLFSLNAFTQNGGSGKSDNYRIKIAVFTPIYLDSAFDAMDTYRYDKIFPKFINPGLEFYEGVQLAIDSLSKEGAKLEVHIYDTRSSTTSLAANLNTVIADSVNLIIAQPGGAEIRQIADVAMKNNIPFINATAPINGGVTGNPFYLQLTPTLKTQIESQYRYIQKYYSLNQLVVFRKKGSREDEIKSYFDEAGKTTVAIPLKLKYVDLPDSFTVKHLTQHLDSTKNFLCIGGSLDEGFGMRLSAQLAAISKSYKITLMGMSTWHNINFAKTEYKGLDIIYGTPFYHAKTDKASISITNHFTTKMYARPSDMVFRGYEVFMRYARLLMQHKTEIASQLASKQYKVFNDFDIQPVLNRSTYTMEYFENKRLSFVKWKDGVVVGVNW
jgi:ABC-type branched-subunit amino acid transport system substrate-binding protein